MRPPDLLHGLSMHCQLAYWYCWTMELWMHNRLQVNSSLFSSLPPQGLHAWLVFIRSLASKAPQLLQVSRRQETGTLPACMPIRSYTHSAF